MNKCQKCKKGRKAARKPAKRCATPGCSALVRSGRFCDRHKKSTPPSGDRTQYHRRLGWFYSSAAWRKFRTWFLQVHPVCVECGAPANQVDHIQPIAEGGEKFEESNCQSLCGSCHSKKTRRENGSGSRRADQGGVETCRAARRLPYVQLKKSVRRLWAEGVPADASSAAIGSESAQNGSKMTLMMDGDAERGVQGGLRLKDTKDGEDLSNG